MIHVTLPQLCAYLDGELAEASVELVRRHLSECMECTERFAGLEEQEAILARILDDEPGEEFFQRLTASIPLGEPTRPERPAAGEWTKSASERGKRGGDSAKRAKPAAERVKTAAERPQPAQMTRRAEDRKSAWSPSAAFIAAAICLVVAGSAAWVVFGPRLAVDHAATNSAERRNPARETAPPETSGAPEEAPEAIAEENSEHAPETAAEAVPEALEPAPEAARPKPKPKSVPAPAPAPERIAERTPRNLVPVRTVVTETALEPAEQNSEPAAAPNAARSATSPDLAEIALRDAKSASYDAARSKTPAAFDKAAEAWEAAIPLLQNAPEALAGARRELAQSRYQAWAGEPTPARREAAIASARQYLLYAPPGPERDQAWTWLGRLKR